MADEPLSSGGKDLGPDPYTLLLSYLAACTLITLRMYIDRKAWNISEITVNINMYQELHEGKTKTWIDRTLIFSDVVNEEQKIRLQEMAKHCPISKILEGDIRIQTNVLDSNR